MIDKLLAEVRSRQAVLTDAIFRSPPRNFEEFQLRLGAWLELNETSDWISKMIRKSDEDEEKDTL